MLKRFRRFFDNSFIAKHCNILLDQAVQSLWLFHYFCNNISFSSVSFALYSLLLFAECTSNPISVHSSMLSLCAIYLCTIFITVR